MLKICAIEISAPLAMIFRKCCDSGTFPRIWKFANVQPVHKKNSRQAKDNYRPISLLPICSKIFEKVIFDSLYLFLVENNLISRNQSGFRPGDSTITQLLAITDEIFRSFETLDETRAVFLDISKAFDKVWHEGLIFKLKQNGIQGDLLRLFQNFLSDRSQRVVLNGKESAWEMIYSGVPQGSVLGPLLFLIYINDLTDDIKSNMKLFADDSSLFLRVTDIDITQNLLMTDLTTVTTWAHQWKMKFNPDITKQAIEVIFSWKRDKPDHPHLNFSGIPVARREYTKHLGIILDEKLSFKRHINEAIAKAKKGIAIIHFLSRHVNREVLNMTYKMYVRPHLDYGDVIYDNQNAESMDILERLQYKIGLLIAGCWQGTSKEKLYDELGWESLKERRKFHRLTLYYKIKNNLVPEYLSALKLQTCPGNSTNRYNKSFYPFCYQNWESLPPVIRECRDNNDNPDVDKFKQLYLRNIRPAKKCTFHIRDRYGVSLLTQLRLGLSDLRFHRCSHGFKNCSSALCACIIADETNEHYLTSCPIHNRHRATLMSSISDITKTDIRQFPNATLTKLLLYGSNDYDELTNKLILEATIKFMKKSKRFKVLEAFAQK